MKTNVQNENEEPYVMNLEQPVAYGLIRNGAVQMVRFGPSLRINPDELREFISLSIIRSKSRSPETGLIDIMAILKSNNPEGAKVEVLEIGGGGELSEHGTMDVKCIFGDEVITDGVSYLPYFFNEEELEEKPATGEVAGSLENLPNRKSSP